MWARGLARAAVRPCSRQGNTWSFLRARGGRICACAHTDQPLIRRVPCADADAALLARQEHEEDVGRVLQCVRRLQDIMGQPSESCTSMISSRPATDREAWASSTASPLAQRQRHPCPRRAPGRPAGPLLWCADLLRCLLLGALSLLRTHTPQHTAAHRTHSTRHTPHTTRSTPSRRHAVTAPGAAVARSNATAPRDPP